MQSNGAVPNRFMRSLGALNFRVRSGLRVFGMRFAAPCKTPRPNPSCSPGGGARECRPQGAQPRSQSLPGQRKPSESAKRPSRCCWQPLASLSAVGPGPVPAAANRAPRPDLDLCCVRGRRPRLNIAADVHTYSSSREGFGDSDAVCGPLGSATEMEPRSAVRVPRPAAVAP